MPEALTLAEASGSLADVQQANGGKFRICLIRAGWGASGYYSERLLREQGPKVWPAGTQGFVDHPGLTETEDRPERSIRDLASILATDPVWDPVTRELVAEVQVFPQHRWLLNKEFAEAVGLSIRARGVAEFGEAEGREGMIVTELTEGISVDWVTRAGAGGKVLELIEAARGPRPAPASSTGSGDRDVSEARTAVACFESRIQLSFTTLADDMYGDGRLTRDERIGLSSAIGDALGAFVTRVEGDFPDLYRRGLWQQADTTVAVTEAGLALTEDTSQTTPTPDGQAPVPAVESAKPDPTDPADPAVAEVVEVATNEPGSPPADNTKEGSMPELTEAQVAAINKERDDALAEAANAKALAEAAATGKAASDLELARFRATETARPIAATALAASTLPSPAQVKVLGETVKSDTIPLRDGVLDESVFKTQVAEAIKAEETYLASLAEQTGAGQVRGLGEAAPAAHATGTATAPAATEALVESYKARGMSDKAARLAAAGRGA